MSTEIIVKPEHGDCECCQKKNCLVQKELIVESMDAFDDRTDGKGNPKDRHHMVICRECFVIPQEEYQWDEDGEYTDLNQLDLIWRTGSWEAKI